MLGHIATSLRLTKASLGLIFRRPVVLVLPLLTVIWTGLLVVGPVSFLLWLADKHPDGFERLWSALYFLTVRALEDGNIVWVVTSFFLTTYALWAVWMTFVFTGSLYFATVGMDVATQQIKHGTSSLGQAFGLASANLHRLFLLALFNAVAIVGFKYLVVFVLRLVPFAGRWLGRAFRFFLTAVTYLVLPIVIYERAGAVSAFRSAWKNIRKTWSGVLIGTSLAFTAMAVLLNVVTQSLLSATLGFEPWTAVILAITIAAIVYAIAMSAAAAMRATLFWYATTGEVPQGFRVDDLPKIETHGPFVAGMAAVTMVGLPSRTNGRARTQFTANPQATGQSPRMPPRNVTVPPAPSTGRPAQQNDRRRSWECPRCQRKYLVPKLPSPATLCPKC